MNLSQPAFDGGLADAFVVMLNRGGTIIHATYLGDVPFRRGSYLCYREHQRRLPWHLFHLVAAAALGLRLIISPDFEPSHG